MDGEPDCAVKFPDLILTTSVVSFLICSPDMTLKEGRRLSGDDCPIPVIDGRRLNMDGDLDGDQEGQLVSPRLSAEAGDLEGEGESRRPASGIES